MENHKSLFQTIRTALANIREELFGFKEHPLESLPQEDRNLYLLFLYVIALCKSNEDNSRSFEFLHRLAISLNEDSKNLINIAEYIGEVGLRRFIERFAQTSFAANFFVDSLLVACVDDDLDNQQLELIAELAEVLRIRADMVTYLCELTVIIAEQDSIRYMTLRDNVPEGISMRQFLVYTQNFYHGLIVNERDYMKFHSKDHSYLEISELIKDLKFKGQTVEFENVVIDQHFPDGWLLFELCPRILFKHSDFIGNKKSMLGLKFYRCEQVVIEYCLFRGINKQVIQAEKGNQIKIFDCRFEDIITNNDALGVVSIEYVNTVSIEHCLFHNCENRSDNVTSYPGSAIRSYTDNGSHIFNLNHCKFINCNSYNKNSKLGDKSVIFRSGARKETYQHNEFIACRNPY
jgi:hypothetical protein